jgi:hypothetical protein
MLTYADVWKVQKMILKGLKEVQEGQAKVATRTAKLEEDLAVLAGKCEGNYEEEAGVTSGRGQRGGSGEALRGDGLVSLAGYDTLRYSAVAYGGDVPVRGGVSRSEGGGGVRDVSRDCLSYLDTDTPQLYSATPPHPQLVLVHPHHADKKLNAQRLPAAPRSAKGAAARWVGAEGERDAREEREVEHATYTTREHRERLLKLTDRVSQLQTALQPGRGSAETGMLYKCPHPAHAAVYVSSYCYTCVLILLDVSSYCCICVLILLHTCPHAAGYLS